ncbi:MAG: cold shock domain-containing protein [Sphingobacteriales bacterium]|nr:MAG: cold shock domain-containing protein [Sphingobacteriales bacterium]
MAQTAAKKEKEKKKAKAKQDKAQKMLDRKDNNNKGKSLEDMMVYLDEDGNFVDTPPDMSKRKEINAADISLEVSRPRSEDEMIVERKGQITYFNEGKGYGFITDAKSKENVFMHVNNLLTPVKERDHVTFETERTPRGLSAIKVKKV